MKKSKNLIFKLIAYFLFFYFLFFIFPKCILIVKYKFTNPLTTKMMEYQLGIKAENVKIEWKKYNEISTNLKRAVVAAEDDNFINHHGVDWNGIKDAIIDNINKDRTRGGSTISQQLVKNLFLTPKKNYVRKLNEIILTFFMELVLSKDRILEIYLNIVEWGDGLYGIQNASIYYFKTSANHLNTFQAAKLASMLNNPKYFQKNFNSEYLHEKAFKILSRMDYSMIPYKKN
ncbi:MAG: monofunctional biosynthetic peptidoglycan transglycosylase [Nitrosomonadales bacterium]